MGRAKVVLIMAMALLTGCWGDADDRLETGDVDLSITIGRLDRDLFHAPTDGLAAASLKAHATYGEFYRLYIEDILQGAPLGDPRLPMVLNRFVTDPDWSSVQEAIDAELGDMEAERKEFEEVFKRLKVLFPNSLVPRIIAFNSGFNYGIVPTDSVLGIGAEWFIGSDHPVIGHLAPEAFPQYVKDRMVPAMMVPSAVKGWLLVHYLGDVEGADVLTNLVEVGKVMVLLHTLLPDTPPHLLFAFSPQQLAWCEAHEYDVWREVVNGELLFSRKGMDVGRLMNDGPFTNGLPRESPGHIGEWIGYRMVRSYLEANPEMDLVGLFEQNDPRAILKHYKPR